MSDQTRKRPGKQTGATSKKSSVGASSGSKYTDLAARARRHDHGVLVLAERKDGIVTSQVFADLAAAERKVWRTRERGLSASLTLVRIVPVPHVHLDELEDGERR